MTGPPQLDLTFRAGSDGSTALAGRRVRHPFSVQAPIRDVRGRPSATRVFIQSTSGGIFAGEDIGQRVEVLAGAELRVEMPAAMVVHTMKDGGSSTQRIELVGQARSILEYLPRPLILFPDSRLQQAVTVRLAADARMLITDGFMVHDPSASGRMFDRFDSTLQVCRLDGDLVAHDRALATGDALQAKLPGVTGTTAALGSVLLLGAQNDMAAERCRSVQATLDGMSGVYGGATLLRDQAGLLVRMLASDGGALVEAQAAAVAMMRGWLHG